MSKSRGKGDTDHPRHRLLDALFGFSRYKAGQMVELNRWKDLYTHVSKTQKKVCLLYLSPSLLLIKCLGQVLENVVGYSKKFETVENLHGVNQKLCDEIVENGLDYYGISREELASHSRAKDAANERPDRVSVSQSLKHFVRDWSTSAQAEREDTLPCILGTMQSLFPKRPGSNVKVLLPGSGLGRLGHEVASLGGFDVTVNERSMYMNLAYRFLEANPRPGLKSLHPFIDSWSHHATNADMFRGVSFPDVRVNGSAVVLVEGDLVSEFQGRRGEYDSVITHFFIDTARNVMSYFDTIHATLKPGGYWVNFGPLLWGTAPFVQLSLDEIVAITQSMGFEFVDTLENCGEATFEGKSIRGHLAVYGFDEKALTRNGFAAQFWVARKVK